MRSHSRKYWVLPVVICGVAFVMAALGGLMLLGAVALSTGAPGGNIALIHITGVLASGSGGGGLLGDSVAGAERIIRQLERARKDRNIKAIVLRINSPGGSAAAAQEIYQEIRRLTGRHNKKVIASLADVAASGAYYVASATNMIVANPATMTGSIGVIMELQNMESLFRKIGLAPETVKSGPYKDMGSPARKLTPEERRILQNMVNQVYRQFVDDVALGRKKMTREQIKVLADGRVYTGEEAKRLGLVDKLGGLQSAIRIAAKAAGITGEPKVVSYDTPSFANMLLGSGEQSLKEFLGETLAGAVRSALIPASHPPLTR